MIFNRFNRFNVNDIFRFLEILDPESSNVQVAASVLRLPLLPLAVPMGATTAVAVRGGSGRSTVSIAGGTVANTEPA